MHYTTPLELYQSKVWGSHGHLVLHIYFIYVNTPPL